MLVTFCCPLVVAVACGVVISIVAVGVVAVSELARCVRVPTPR